MVQIIQIWQEKHREALIEKLRFFKCFLHFWLRGLIFLPGEGLDWSLVDLDGQLQQSTEEDNPVWCPFYSRHRTSLRSPVWLSLEPGVEVKIPSRSCRKRTVSAVQWFGIWMCHRLERIFAEFVETVRELCCCFGLLRLLVSTGSMRNIELYLQATSCSPYPMTSLCGWLLTLYLFDLVCYCCLLSSCVLLAVACFSRSWVVLLVLM